MSAPRCGAPEDHESPTVAAVLRRFLSAFHSCTPASPHALQVLRRLSRCHTGQLGWALWQCERCQRPHWRPLGCGDRHCPECTSRAREAWLGKQRAALLPVRYYHWVFTLPAALRPLALQNPKAIYSLLFDSASQTLLQFGEERLGVRLGVTALLHTWGQNLMDHPHVHCLVTGGGLVTSPGPSPEWRGPKQSRYLFPVQAVAAMFRGKFLAGLKALRAEGKLEFHGRLKPLAEPVVWGRTLGALHGAKWVVFGKGSVAGPDCVLEYLGRYTHRVAISNGRIVRVDDRTVTFRYKDYRGGDALKEMTLDGVEFVRRLSLHILPAGFTKIRHYGILGNNRRATSVLLARAALENSRWRLDASPAPAAAALPKRKPGGCPHCTSDEIVCLGRLDAHGRFHAVRRGVASLLAKTTPVPAIQDSS